MLELHVDHDDRRDEAHLVRVLDRGGTLEGLLLEAHVVEPYLPQLARAIVDVRVRNDPRLLVDQENPLGVGVLRELRDALDDVHVALLPALVEGPVDLLVPLHRVALAVDDPDDVLLTEVLEVHPGDVAAVAVVAVDVGVLPEERVRALRGGQTTYPPE